MQRNGQRDSREGALPSAAVMPSINRSEVRRTRGGRGGATMPRGFRAGSARDEPGTARQRASIAFSDFRRSLPAAFSAAASPGGKGVSE